jgi:hypothetical protein
MGGADVVINAIDAALQEREEVLVDVGREAILVDVLAGGMEDGFVLLVVLACCRLQLALV